MRLAGVSPIQATYAEITYISVVCVNCFRDECPVLMLQFIITRPGRHQTEWKNGAAPFQGVYIPGLKCWGTVTWYAMTVFFYKFCL